MGQKVNPVGFRLIETKQWQSKWIARRDYGKFLQEDIRVRDFVKERLKHGAVTRVEIQRTADEMKVVLWSARPGIVIGRRGTDIDRLREELQEMTNRQISIDIQEVKSPELSAELVGRNIGEQLVRRISFRRAMKRAVAGSMNVSGDLNVTGTINQLDNDTIIRQQNTSWILANQYPPTNLTASAIYTLTPHTNSTGGGADNCSVSGSCGDTGVAYMNYSNIGNFTLTDGSMGIGTASPIGSLDVRSNEVRIWDGSASITYATSAGELYVENDLEVDGNIHNEDGFIVSDRFQADTTGTVGVPAFNYEVAGANNDYGIYFPGGTEIGFSIAGSDVLRIDSLGNLGIGITSLGHRLEVAGSVKISGGLNASEINGTNVFTQRITLNNATNKADIWHNGSGICIGAC